MNEEIKKLTTKAQEYAEMIEKVRTEISKVIVGQNDAVEKIIIALIANGHVLVEGVPGLAKTLMVHTLAQTMDSKFVRLQFTPDLLPADIIGTKIYDHNNLKFNTVKGPIFSNFILADEINRAPPKVQSALLEAMQEKQVSIQGNTFKIEEPFMVLATQNPVENEGTYKLPEAQLDRFMMKLKVSYPSKDEEVDIITRFTEGQKAVAQKILSVKNLIEMQKFNHKIYADDKIKDYVAEIVDATRNPEKYGINLGNYIEYGASPRASLWLILGAKANAMINGRGYVVPEDVHEVVHDVLRHRVLMTYEAEAENVQPEDVVKEILEKVKVP
ncbi:MoxR family ATPase [Candidatus Woesearchaeota archaeon]|nr:MAG: MoxR family ATPase [Candidatus Woesearchaeota archaeon]